MVKVFKRVCYIGGVTDQGARDSLKPSSNDGEDTAAI
jgi:hypothetical protein